MVPLVSRRILGDALDSRALADSLSDGERLRQVVSGLPVGLQELLLDLYEAGGVADQEILARTLGCTGDALRADLEELGRIGLVFQGGLSGREPLILLPSLEEVMESIRASRYEDPGSLAWDVRPRPGLWAHLTLVNALASFKIRCKAGLEPFKKGWELLETRLGHVMDLRTVYDELVELGCLRVKDAFVAVVQHLASAFAMEGDLRYVVWRFSRSCRERPGLDHRVFLAVGDRAVSRGFLVRVLVYWMLQRALDPTRDIQAQVEELIDEWTAIGALEQDATGNWVRFAPDVYQALKTGRMETRPQPYADEVIVQPTMEILVPRDFDPVDLLNVGEMADLVQADVVSIYRITRDSVSRAVKAGWTEDRMVGFLERVSVHSIPDTVRMNLSGWCRLHPEAHLIRGTFLVYGGDKAVLPKGLEEVLPGIFRVPQLCEEAVEAFLSKRGVVLRDTEEAKELEHELQWGRMGPVAPSKPRGAPGIVLKEGVFPYGMVSPLPFGTRREALFEEALRQRKDLVIFYPRQGYGEMQVRRICPLYIFRKGGMPFMEAYCEDTKDGEVFDLSKVRAVLRDA
jgi:hypothetical protein